MALGTRSGGGALRKQECCMPLLQALDEKSSKLEDFWNAKTEVVRNKLDRHGAGDTSWIDSIAMCPVYYPTKEDFMQDPLCYIQKIAAEASKFGMCKIVSPVVASVPAGMVLSKEQSGFKFTTRIQPLRLSNWDKDDKITFPMSGRNYTLTEYEKMANRVFSRKFSTAGNLPPRFIESEFWKELAFGKTRTVEYATDVEGSAFSSSSMDPLGQSKWNLKEISRLPYSTLRLLEDVIPGVTEPMLYIGMLFSMFSWHIEDHYLYSINYQHCGAPKTWYGVPGDAALCFEKVVQEQVYNSELLQDTGKGAELDLLLEKTTLFTPKLLAEQGVPVFKAVQYPGEFIVTFPRAYHAGFSHGFNCGEAVNFAMADWFLLGAEACLRYEFLNRFPLLPHEMLLCKEAAIISQINQTGHENSSCELQSHVKVAFVACVQSLLQSISSLKKQGAKITTSNETSVFCGLCKHSCYVAYTSCKCFPEPTCFNHGEFFSICTCKSERIIVLKDEFADLEAVAQKYECEVEIMSRVQKLVSHYDSLETKDGSRFAQDVHFEKSSLIDAKDSGECCKTQEEKEKADNGGVNAQVESGNGVMSSVCTLGQEEELSDTEVVQFKRRKVSLSQKKHFQVDEQEITPERHILTLKNTNCPKVESSCLTAREYSLGLEALDRQAVVSVAEVDKAAISTTHESFDTTSDSEVMSKRKKLQGALVKVKRKRSVAIVKDLLLAAEFNIERAVKQAEESEYADFRNCSDLMVGSTRSSDSSVPTSKEGQNQEVEEKGMERTQCMETWNKDDNLQGRAELLKIDTSSVNKNHTEHSSSAVLRIEADPPFEITRNLTDERNLIEDSTNWNSRTVVSNSAEVDTRGSATVSHDDDAFVTTPKAAVRIETDPPFEIARSLTDEINLIEDSTNWNSRNVISNLIKVDTRESATVSNDDDACVIIPTASVADEGKPFHTEGCSSSCEYRECEAGPFVLRNGCSVISSPAEAQPLAGLVEVQKAESNAPNTEANIMPLKDCGKSMPKKGLVIHLNRKAEQVHKQKVADVFYDEDKSSICENLMEQVNILEGQSEGSAWCLDQEVVSSYSDQNNCKWFSPSGPSTLICGDDLIEDSSKFVKNEESSKRKCLLDMGQLTVGQQEAGNVLGLQDDLGFKFHKPASHSEFYDYANRWQIHEGESSSTQYSYAMPSLVPGCAPATIEGVSENINVKNAIPPAECCKWQKSEIASHSTSKGPRGLSSAGVCVPGDDYLQKFSSSDASLDTRSSGLDSSTLHQSEGHASNFVGKPLYQTRNFGAVDFDMFPGQSTNWRQRHLQGHADFSARHSTGGANNYPRVGPSNNYKSRSRYRNHRPFQHDNVRTMKYPRTFHKKPSCHEERRPRRHFSQGWRGGSLENNRRQFGADNPRMKGMLDTGFSAASSSAGSVHDEGYDPMKWEISPPVTNPWQFSSIVHHVSSGWAEQRL